MDNNCTVEVRFTPEEVAAFLARTDREDGETILWPYEAFIFDYLGEWHSLWPLDQSEWPEIEEDDDAPMPCAASGYGIELIDPDYVAIFNNHVPAIRRGVDALEAFKSKWPHRVELMVTPATAQNAESYLHGSFIDIIFADEIAYAREQSHGAVAHPFYDEGGIDTAIFGFERKEDAAMFKMRWK